MDKKALCVGINTFKYYPGASLQGCVNDARDMSSLLQASLGFTAQEITVLTDREATKANIMQSLQAMVKDACSGKLTSLVFSLSSHGTQVPDLNGDEEDVADEAFCPHDLVQTGNGWDPAHIITDDELHDLFSRLPGSVVLEVFLDTCHSGTGLKAIDLLLTRRPRYMPPPSLDAFDRVAGRTVRTLASRFGEGNSLGRHILWTGCRADQTSADALIEGTWHGAFTYYFCREMRGRTNTLSRRKVLKNIRAALVAERYSQTPQLECAATVRE